MRRLILDYFRRWAWVLALAGMLEFGLGWLIANRPGDNFEFLGLMVALWTGTNLLSFDLRRGVVRAVAPLPLTARQIGRSWWLATVAIPAVVLAALLFLGGGAFYHLHPNKVFPADRLAWASIFNLMWLGTISSGIFSATRDLYRNMRDFAGSGGISWLSGIMLLGGMIYFQDASKRPFKCVLFLGVGGLLTVVSWLRAERFSLGRAVPFVPPIVENRLTPLQPTASSARYRPPAGDGGIPFLIRTTFVRIFLWVAAMIGLMALLQQWQGQTMPRPGAIATFAGMGSFMSCGFIILLAFLPVLRQLRFLRTLPISATRLAAVMIAIVILPLIALGALVAGGAWLALGTAAAVTVLKSYTFMLAPASLCVFFGVWRGDSMQTYALLVITLFGFQTVQLPLLLFFHYLVLPFGRCGPIAAICVLLAFLLTRRALMRSSRTYLVQATPFGNVLPGMGR